MVENKVLEDKGKEDIEIKNYAKKLVDLNEKKRNLKKELGIIEDEKKKIVEILIEVFRIKGITSIVFKELGNVYLHIGSFPSIKDPASLEKWLKDNQLFETMFSFNKNKLGAFCRECVEDSKSLPDGVELFTKEDVRIKKH